jgi:hypothetical protein
MPSRVAVAIPAEGIDYQRLIHLRELAITGSFAAVSERLRAALHHRERMHDGHAMAAA